jgi:hypothetical protein
MAYIGKQPIVGNFVKLDAITTSATTTFNLLNGGVAYFPQTANNCLVSLNGILQAPTDSYTISGSTIVFSSALTTSDVIDFIIVLGDVLNIGTPSDNTVSLAKLTATGTKDSTTFLRGDNTFVNVYNTPSFFVYPTTGQTATHNSTNKITFGTESYDTDSAFASSRFTVPTGKAGKYYIHASVYTEAAANGTLEVSNIFIYINGVAKFGNANDFRTNQIRGFTTTVSGSFNLAVGDYVEIYHYYYSSALANGTYGSGDNAGTYFGGYKITE